VPARGFSKTVIRCTVMNAMDAHHGCAPLIIRRHDKAKTV
jgi:hypothetical protein